MAEQMFTWVPFYHELAEKFLQYHNKRSDLITIVRSVYHEAGEKLGNVFRDEAAQSDIDPFTLFAGFNFGKQGSERRKGICDEYRKAFNMTAQSPLNFDGVPMQQHRQKYFYIENTSQDEFDQLWELFSIAFTFSMELLPYPEKIHGFCQLYSSGDNNGHTQNKLTKALFYIRPDIFISLDEKSRARLITFTQDEKLSKELQTTIYTIAKGKVLEGKDYLYFCKAIAEYLSSVKHESLVEFSYHAYTEGNLNTEALEEEEKPMYKHPLNTILYGPPGTGKTYNAAYYAVAIIEGVSVEEIKERYTDYDTLMVEYKKLIDAEQIRFTTFHQSYGYEDFIEGIKPILKAKGKKESVGSDIQYELKDGVFKKFCLEAKKQLNKRFVFIIDEINRGNISKIFGELITLIEDSKRDKRTESVPAILPYSQDKFAVPQNVYIVGTMNTADRSIALLDTALRRRFIFKEMMPNPDVDFLHEIEVDGCSISQMLKTMNKKIEVLYDREHMIGHAYFKDLAENQTRTVLATIFRDQIIPLLQEYFYDDYEKIRIVLGDNKTKDTEKQFVLCESLSDADIAAFGETELTLTDYRTYRINDAAFGNIESYKKIYMEI